MRRVVVGILIVLAVAAGVSGIANYAYNLGVAQGVASVATRSGTGAAPVYPYGAYPGYPYAAPWHGPFGFGIVGLVWPILLIVLVVALLRRSMRWGGSCGPRGGGPRWLEEWHRRAHESTGSTGTV